MWESGHSAGRPTTARASFTRSSALVRESSDSMPSSWLRSVLTAVRAVWSSADGVWLTAPPLVAPIASALIAMTRATGRALRPLRAQRCTGMRALGETNAIAMGSVIANVAKIFLPIVRGSRRHSLGERSRWLREIAFATSDAQTLPIVCFFLVVNEI